MEGGRDREGEGGRERGETAVSSAATPEMKLAEVATYDCKPATACAKIVDAGGLVRTESGRFWCQVCKPK